MQKKGYCEATDALYAEKLVPVLGLASLTGALRRSARLENSFLSREFKVSKFGGAPFKFVRLNAIHSSTNVSASTSYSLHKLAPLKYK